VHFSSGRPFFGCFCGNIKSNNRMVASRHENETPQLVQPIACFTGVRFSTVDGVGLHAIF
jgi:hypothetical protein